VKIYICENALRAKSISKESIVDGVKIIGFATFIDMALDAKSVINI
jgi:predicted peroxiredoxin